MVKHDDVIKWKHFPRYWPFVRGMHQSPVNSPHKGQWRWGWWFETPSCPLWRHCNDMGRFTVYPKKYAHGFCFAVLCCGYTLTDFPYPSGLLHWHCGNLTIAPVPAKQPWWIRINTSYEFIMNNCITTTKQSTTKPCAYFLGYTVAITMGVNYGILQTNQRRGWNHPSFVKWIVEIFCLT